MQTFDRRSNIELSRVSLIPCEVRVSSPFVGDSGKAVERVLVEIDKLLIAEDLQNFGLDPFELAAVSIKEAVSKVLTTHRSANNKR